MEMTKQNELRKLLTVLQQEVTKYHDGYTNHLVQNLLGDEQHKKPIGESLQDLRQHRAPSWTVAPKMEETAEVVEVVPRGPHP
jgi:hypothetical protein